MSEPGVKRRRVEASLPGHAELAPAPLSLLDLPNELLHAIMLHASDDPLAANARRLSFVPRHLLEVRLVSRALNCVVCALVRPLARLDVGVDYDEKNMRLSSTAAVKHGLGAALNVELASMGAAVLSLGAGSLLSCATLVLTAWPQGAHARAKPVAVSPNARAVVATFARVRLVLRDATVLERGAANLAELSQLGARSLTLVLPSDMPAFEPTRAFEAALRGLDVAIDISACRHLTRACVPALRSFSAVYADGARTSLLRALRARVPDGPEVYAYGAEYVRAVLHREADADAEAAALVLCAPHLVERFSERTQRGTVAARFLGDVVRACVQDSAAFAYCWDRAHHFIDALHANALLEPVLRELDSHMHRFTNAYSLLLLLYAGVAPSVPLLVQCCRAIMWIVPSPRASLVSTLFAGFEAASPERPLAEWMALTHPGREAEWPLDAKEHWQRMCITLPSAPASFFTYLLRTCGANALVAVDYVVDRAPAAFTSVDAHGFSALDILIGAIVPNGARSRMIALLPKLATRELLAERHVHFCARSARINALMGDRCTSLEFAFLHGDKCVARVLVARARELGVEWRTQRLLLALVCAASVAQDDHAYGDSDDDASRHIQFMCEFVRANSIDLSAPVARGCTAHKVAAHLGLELGYVLDASEKAWDAA